MLYEISRWVEFEFDYDDRVHRWKFRRPPSSVCLGWTKRAQSVQREIAAAADGGIPDYDIEDYRACTADLAEWAVEYNGRELPPDLTGDKLDALGYSPDFVVISWAQFFAKCRAGAELRGKSEPQSSLASPPTPKDGHSTTVASARI